MSDRGPWTQVHTGRAFYVLDPRPEDVHINDIAHALSNLCRYNGHTWRFYSVAEHCVHVSRALPPEAALWGLLHDASEAYLGDFTRPLKQAVPEIRTVEELVLRAVAERLGLPWPCPPEVKRADLAMLAAEAPQVMAKEPRDWWLPEPPLPVKVEFWPPAKAESMFRLRYLELATANKESYEHQ